MIVAYSRPHRHEDLPADSGTPSRMDEQSSRGDDPRQQRSGGVAGRHRHKAHKEELAAKFKDNGSPLKIAIVVDMWLTGFDVPSLATMCVYKPMAGHNLMQAIARVNRVFGDKEGSLVVDYVGIASAEPFPIADFKCSLTTTSMSNQNCGKSCCN